MDVFNVIILTYAQNKGRIDELSESTFTSLIYAFYLGAAAQPSSTCNIFAFVNRTLIL